MNQTPVKLGPLALLLTVISICLTILSILSFTTAEADLRLAGKYADTVSERYALEIRGQKVLKALDEELSQGRVPSDFAPKDNGEDDVLYNTLTDEDMSLTIGVKIDTSEMDYTVVSWDYDHDWVQKDTIDNLWPGNG